MDVAVRAGISERTLFRAFPSKDAIFWHEPFLSRIARVLTPVDASPDRAFRTTLFARFAVAGFGIVPIYSDTTALEWGQTLVRVARLAWHRPLTDGAA